MERITKRDLINSVAERWHAQYFRNGKWRFFHNDPEATYRKLLNLDEAATEKDVYGIIGNCSWTRNGCDECGKSSETAILFNGPSLESSVNFCIDCLRKAISLGIENETS